MATWIVGDVVVLIVGAIVWKMIRDKRNGKGGCGGDCGDCAHCHGSCDNQPK